MKICIAYPSPEYLHHQFVNTVINLLVANSKNYEISLLNVVSSRIAFNRNKLVEQAKEHKADYILFIDADMVVPPTAIETLLDHDKDIVCATASCRIGENVGKMQGNPVDDNQRSPEENSSLIEMKMVGLPLMLIKMSVFDKLEEPYFAEPILGKNLIPEDEYFCIKAREAGFQIWCDVQLSMKIGHVGTAVYYIQPN